MSPERSKLQPPTAPLEKKGVLSPQAELLACLHDCEPELLARLIYLRVESGGFKQALTPVQELKSYRLLLEQPTRSLNNIALELRTTAPTVQKSHCALHTIMRTIFNSRGKDLSFQPYYFFEDEHTVSCIQSCPQEMIDLFHDSLVPTASDRSKVCMDNSGNDKRLFTTSPAPTPDEVWHEIAQKLVELHINSTHHRTLPTKELRLYKHSLKYPSKPIEDLASMFNLSKEHTRVSISIVNGTLESALKRRSIDINTFKKQCISAREDSVQIIKKGMEAALELEPVKETLQFLPHLEVLLLSFLLHGSTVPYISEKKLPLKEADIQAIDTCIHTFIFNKDTDLSQLHELLTRNLYLYWGQKQCHWNDNRPDVASFNFDNAIERIIGLTQPRESGQKNRKQEKVLQMYDFLTFLLYYDFYCIQHSKNKAQRNDKLQIFVAKNGKGITSCQDIDEYRTLSKIFRSSSVVPDSYNIYIHAKANGIVDDAVFANQLAQLSDRPLVTVQRALYTGNQFTTNMILHNYSPQDCYDYFALDRLELLGKAHAAIYKQFNKRI